MTLHNAAAHPAFALMGLQLDLPEDTPLRALRAAIGDRLDAMIAFLDATEPDPDLEPDADGEPSLGWTNVWQQKGSDDDREFDCDSDEADAATGTADDEPRLGWTTSGYIGTTAGNWDDDEPSLGALVDSDRPQPGWGFSGTSDREDDGDLFDAVDEDGSGELAGGDRLGADEGASRLAHDGGARAAS